MQLESLTNVKPSKDLGRQLVLTPSKGHIKLTPEAATTVGVVDKEYAQIVTDKATGTNYVVKGEKGIGNKLAGNKAGAGALSFSATNAWETLGGKETHNVFFDVAEEGVVFNERTFFALTLDREEEKQARKKRSANSTADADVTKDEVATSEQAVADTDAPVTSNEFGDL